MLGHGGYRKMGYTALGADDAYRLEDSAAALVSRQALGDGGRGGAFVQLGFNYLRGGIVR